MTCSFPPELTEDQISAALDGSADDQIQSHLAQCPGCSARLQTARATEGRLHKLLFRWDCPSSHTLGDYALELLPEADMQAVRTHLQTCPRCQAEMVALNRFMEMDFPAEPAAPSKPKPAPKQRPNIWLPRPVQGMPAFAARGESSESSLFEVNGVTIFLETQEDAGQRWLVGRLITPDFPAWMDALVELWQNGAIVTVAAVDQAAGFRCRLSNRETFDLSITSKEGIVLTISGIRLAG